MIRNKYSFVYSKKVLKEIKDSPFQSVYTKIETQTKFLLKGLEDHDVKLFQITSYEKSMRPEKWRYEIL